MEERRLPFVIREPFALVVVMRRVLEATLPVCQHGISAEFIAELHGQLELSSPPEGGLNVRARLPLPAAAGKDTRP